MFRSFTVRVPASTSNVGSGFDTLSAALGLYLSVHVRSTGDGQIRWTGGWDLPIEDNIVDVALRRTLQRFGRQTGGIALSMENPIPLKRGLGSSGAAIIAGIKIAEEICRERLTNNEVFDIGYPLEGHPDNLSASLLGGWVLSRVQSGIMRAEPLHSAVACRFVVAIPEKAVSTREARAILPACYSREDAIFNVQRCALVVHALASGRKDLLREAIRDRLHQPYRAKLVPGLEEVLELSGLPSDLEDAVMGVAISGSGSGVIAFADDCYEAVGAWMVDCLASHGTPSHYLVYDLDRTGATIRPD